MTGTKGAGSTGTISAALNKVVNNLSTTMKSLTWTGTSMSTGSFHLDAGSYKFDWSGNVTKGAINGTASLSTAVAPTPVPGPEAGAGIGALAMGGIALYLKRRRKDENLAA